MIRIYTAGASIVGTCDQCGAQPATTLYAPEQVITLVTLHRGEAVAFAVRFCEKHFLLFSDLIADQVAALLYPKVKANP